MYVYILSEIKLYYYYYIYIYIYICVCVCVCIYINNRAYSKNILTRLKKVVLYSAISSPSDRSKRRTLFAFPGRHVQSDTNSAFPGSILAVQQLRATTKSLTFSPLSIARY